MWEQSRHLAGDTTIDPCLVLMLKRPQQSKRRIALQLGPLADELAELLLGCALQDLAEWSGSVCLAPADGADLSWADSLLRNAGRRYLLAQRDGNLGQRIMLIDNLLREMGEQRLIMLGTDCPAMDAPYLSQAAQALRHHNVVLGPARDGGVVLMGSAQPWPPLAGLPWSTPHLAADLAKLCESGGQRVAMLPERGDVDTVDDVLTLNDTLVGDERASRVALRDWLTRHAHQLGSSP